MKYFYKRTDIITDVPKKNLLKWISKLKNIHILAQFYSMIQASL